VLKTFQNALWTYTGYMRHNLHDRFSRLGEYFRMSREEPWVDLETFSLSRSSFWCPYGIFKLLKLINIILIAKKNSQFETGDWFEVIINKDFSWYNLIPGKSYMPILMYHNEVTLLTSGHNSSWDVQLKYMIIWQHTY